MASEFVIYLIGINVLTFLIYGIDKWKARRGKWRIPEDTLIWLAIAGGSIGALLGMYLFRHKTQHHLLLPPKIAETGAPRERGLRPYLNGITNGTNADSAIAKERPAVSFFRLTAKIRIIPALPNYRLMILVQN